MQPTLLYIDLFCGAGGTSTGVEYATLNGEKCAKVIACVNHDPHAIASHVANHPHTLHFTEDIRTLELSPLVAHTESLRLLHPNAHLVLWASLECTNFSKAKGGQPRDADSPEEAMKLASCFTDEHITAEDFEDSEVSVVACETYPSDIDDYESDERIFTADGVMTHKKYRELL